MDYALWVVSALLEAGVGVCALRSRAFSRYFALNLYMLSELSITVSRYVVFSRYGYSSSQYFYFYYFSGALLAICLYLSLMNLYSHVFKEMKVQRYLRVGAMLLLAGTALVSYKLVMDSRDRMVTHFVVELGQNLYFVGVVLTYLLWGAIMKLRETRTRLIQLVLALGVYFSAYAANYALRNLYPAFPIWRYLLPLMAFWLPLAWGYTFLRIPEEARLATAQVAATQR